jgi:hypothetical protein
VAGGSSAAGMVGTAVSSSSSDLSIGSLHMSSSFMKAWALVDATAGW